MPRRSFADRILADVETASDAVPDQSVRGRIRRRRIARQMEIRAQTARSFDAAAKPGVQEVNAIDLVCDIGHLGLSGKAATLAQVLAARALMRCQMSRLCSSAAVWNANIAQAAATARRGCAASRAAAKIRANPTLGK